MDGRCLPAQVLHVRVCCVVVRACLFSLFVCLQSACFIVRFHFCTISSIYFFCMKAALGGQGAADGTREMICSIEALRGTFDPTPLVGSPGQALFTEADFAVLHMEQRRKALQRINQDTGLYFVCLSPLTVHIAFRIQLPRCSITFCFISLPSSYFPCSLVLILFTLPLSC